MNSTIARNICNLTSLWQTVGEKHGSFSSLPSIEYSIVKNSQWPNRLWFRQKVSDELIHQAKHQLETISTKLIIPIWDLGNLKLDTILNKVNFQLLFQQIGMSFEPREIIETSDILHLKKVSNATEADLWSDAFRKSFGYEINSNILLRTQDSINYIIVYKENDAVGTVITFETNRTLGIHAMGVIPQYRKQGIANEIMANVINSAIEQNIGLLTLQASDMGKDLYLRLGFEEQFVVKNYVLQQTQSSVS
ncbi:MAG: GNAT family N-acetyltransferase [Cyclobacteriaceae bacterium]